MTFVGCPQLDGAASCRMSEYVPGVIEVVDGGRVVLQGSQVVCTPGEASPPGELLSDLMNAEGDIQVSEVWRIGSRKVFVNAFDGCAGGSMDDGSWKLQDVALVCDMPSCFSRGLVVSNGKELQRALMEPNPNIYLAEDITMVESEWPENGTHVSWPVNITACGGVVLDTNDLAQTLFIWTGGRMLIDGHNNFTIANSRPSVRRGNVWQLVGAVSVEVNGSITLQVNLHSLTALPT